MNPRIQAAAKAAKALQVALKGDADKVPPGWFTRDDYQTANKIQAAQAGVRLKQMRAMGIAEEKSFRIVTRAGVRPVPHYRVR